MLLTLNDDCLYLICIALVMEDHMALSQTSERLRQVIASYYMTHNQVTLDDKIWSKNEQQRQEFLATFRNNIEPYINELRIKAIDIEQMDLLDQLPLGKITALELQTSRPIEDSYKPDLDKYFSSLSVQLKSLSWRGNKAFKLIPNHKFPNLTKLHVCDHSDNINVKVDMFPALENLQLYGSSVSVADLCELKNLSTLELNYVCLLQQDLQMLFGALALKKLQIYTTSRLTFDGISKCQTLEELVLYESILHGSLDELTTLMNLKRITVIGAFMPIFEHPNAVCKRLSLTKREILLLSNPKLATKLRNLQFLKIFLPADAVLNSSKESFFNAMFEVLKNSHNLRLLQIYGPDFYAIEILEKMAQVSGHIYGERKETLSILFVSNLRDGLKEPERFQNLSFPNFVKFSFKDFENYNYGHPQLHCDWQTANG